MSNETWSACMCTSCTSMWELSTMSKQLVWWISLALHYRSPSNWIPCGESFSLRGRVCRCEAFGSPFFFFSSLFSLSSPSNSRYSAINRKCCFKFYHQIFIFLLLNYFLNWFYFLILFLIICFDLVLILNLILIYYLFHIIFLVDFFI